MDRKKHGPMDVNMPLGKWRMLSAKFKTRHELYYIRLLLYVTQLICVYGNYEYRRKLHEIFRLRKVYTHTFEILITIFFPQVNQYICRYADRHKSRSRKCLHQCQTQVVSQTTKVNNSDCPAVNTIGRIVYTEILWGILYITEINLKWRNESNRRT